MERHLLLITFLYLLVPPAPVITSISNRTDSEFTDNVTVIWTFSYDVVSIAVMSN